MKHFLLFPFVRFIYGICTQTELICRVVSSKKRKVDPSFLFLFFCFFFLVLVFSSKGKKQVVNFLFLVIGHHFV